MSTAIILATGEHMGQLLDLMQRSVVEADPTQDTDTAQLARQHAIKPLLSGGQEGAAWLIGPTRGPLGYVIVTFGWSLALGGREAWIEDLYIRPSVRRRGIGTEVLHSISVSLRQGEVRALQVRVSKDDTIASGFCSQAGFALQNDIMVMTDLL